MSKQTNTNSRQIYLFRLIGISEGVSYLLLLGIAMPLKYFYGMPEAVKYSGWIHGVLFMAYMAVALRCLFLLRWNLWSNFLLFAAALFPFGPFLIDGKLKKAQNVLRENEKNISAVVS
jgi:integral membrane protein